MALSRRASGQTLVEFALLLLVLVPLLFLVMEMGRVLDAWIVVDNAAREGARYAASGADMATVSSKAYAYLQDGFGSRTDVFYSPGNCSGATGICVSKTLDAGGVPGQATQVTVKVQVEVLQTKFWSWAKVIVPDKLTIGRTATMRLL